MKLIVGNWKMNGLTADSRERVEKLASGFESASAEMVLCPPSTLLHSVIHWTKNFPLFCGAQDCHARPGHVGDQDRHRLLWHGAADGDLGASTRNRQRRV